ncbi:cytochrome b/b6 domain-containing protein [Novosphingobium mangrovi (ex Huang et al. 2023)]|uniref:Cytochrome b/b6 domain-containing protein n=1 Tax=Novosphingobium mangrovi (ex Huang et al. 2023) TaxID=2976432 RepID=A0ABT2I2C7_9SPHN|nr:cytochrome b/b6 domain-containing protein [Novosphingobium mangrovi (ex Huang et al. 2023)]MCT2398961.1 cytochrome b/b6 domain-containing protein [Novosphingobium mangrovi (ex Huang et al. 2023)]
MTESPIAGSTRVWDLPVRLFHWLLVPLIAFSWWSGEEHYMDWHRLSGYAILALLVFRIWWGFAGSRTARFGQFVRSPGTVLAYAKTLGSRSAHAADGHNPLGGWSVIAMLAVLVTMVVAGLFAVDVDGFESGPLADYVTFDQGRAAAEFHETVFNAIVALVALHVAAIVFYLGFKRLNLVRPMITGRRARAAGEAAADVRWSPLLALVGLVLAGAIAWAVSTGFRF